MSLETTSVWQKLGNIKISVEAALSLRLLHVPVLPARDVAIFEPGQLPPKKGLSSREGQARLLHDLASIELQAMELCLRTLIEYPEAPHGFREELAVITLSEARHLTLCLQSIEKLGHKWGDWPVHLQLWKATDAKDTLLDRILIVHRYLEGSGLDAGDTFMKKLDGVGESFIHPVVKTIVTEEIEHVEFGSRWYREICKIEKIDSIEDFPRRMQSLRYRIPKRIEKIAKDLRLQAGFTLKEITYLEELRASIVKYPKTKLKILVEHA